MIDTSKRMKREEKEKEETRKRKEEIKAKRKVKLINNFFIRPINNT